MSNIYKEYEAPSTAGLYLKLEDNKPVKLRIASQPYIYRDSYTDKASGVTQESVRYAWIVYNFTAEMAQILRLPVTGFKMLQAIAADDDWGDPTEYNLTVKRSGTGKQTEYSVTPTPNRVALTDEQNAAVTSVDILGALKNAITLVEAHKGKPLPKPAPRGEETAEASGDASAPARAKDVVIDDLPESEKVNLDDIPF